MRTSRLAVTKSQLDAPAARVTAGHPPGARVGAELPRRGGNAVNAAVAMTFATAIAEPLTSRPGEDVGPRPPSAVEAPGPPTEGGPVRVDDRMGWATVAALAGRGHPMAPLTETSSSFHLGRPAAPARGL